VLAAIGIKMVIYPQEILAATVLAVRAALAGLNGGAKAAMANAVDLAAAIRSGDYLALDERLARGG
jgi:2-methylisocitrate lyase-like PEP mutase family enzyme